MMYFKDGNTQESDESESYQISMYKSMHSSNG